MQSFIILSLLSALVQGGYIVTLKSSDRGDVTEAHLDKVRALFAEQRSATNEIKHIYGSVFQGYSAELTEGILARVKAMPEVQAVEVDQVAKAAAVQPLAPWGLARISSPGKLSGTPDKPFPYTHDPNGGNGVDVFVLDTGINVAHPDFQGHAVWGANFVPGAPNADDNGHGTHCAGTVGSRTYGIAKSSQVVAVKVLDARASGLNSQIIAGVDWVVKNNKKGRACVINMSLTGGKSDATNAAVRAATSANCLVVAAAGNDNVDACKYSPASEPSAITVGATNIQDSRASFSNWGQCLDVFGPGENIISLSNQGGSRYDSGTSMAAPHVAGLAAYLMTKTQNASPAYITNLILSISQKNVIANVAAGSPNLLISNAGYQS